MTSLNKFLTRASVTLCPQRTTLASVVALAFLSCLFVFVFSHTASPWCTYTWMDQAYWMVIGRGINEGMIPYADLYDHKGPLLFFLYALVCRLSDGNLGLFFMESLCLTASLVYVSKTARLFVPASWSLLIVGAYLLYMMATMEGGAGCEELSQPFILVPMYYVLRHCLQKNGEPASAWLSVALGFCGGCLVMIRATNAAYLFGAYVALLYLQMRCVSLRAFFLMVSWSVVGLIAAVSPFLVYFGVHGALMPFFEGAFLHNASYASMGGEGKSLSLHLEYIWRVISLVPLIWLINRERKCGEMNQWTSLVLILSGLTAALVLSAGYGYGHYFVNYALVPLFVLILMIRNWLRSRADQRPTKRGFLLRLAAVYGVFLLAFWTCLGWLFLFRGTNLLTGGTREKMYNRAAEELAALIPEGERNSVWGYDLSSNAYKGMNILPCYRYFTLQSNYISVYPKIGDEIRQMLSSNPPRYLLVPDSKVPDFLRQAICDHYDFFAESPNPLELPFTIYKRRSSATSPTNSSEQPR